MIRTKSSRDASAPGYPEKENVFPGNLDESETVSINRLLMDFPYTVHFFVEYWFITNFGLILLLVDCLMKVRIPMVLKWKKVTKIFFEKN